MRKLLTTFVCVWFTLAVWAGDGIYEKLQQIPQISEIQKLDVKPFQEYYQFWFEQPVDHSDPAKGTFRQRVLLGHKQSDAPVIVELEGYNIWSSEEGELANILKGNQLTIEHRFFDQSVPEGGIPWENLTSSRLPMTSTRLYRLSGRKFIRHRNGSVPESAKEDRRRYFTVIFTRPMWISVYRMWLP